MKISIVVLLVTLAGCHVIDSSDFGGRSFSILENVKHGQITKNTRNDCKKYLVSYLNKNKLKNIPSDTEMVFLQYSVGNGMLQGLYFYSLDSKLFVSNIYSNNLERVNRRDFLNMLDKLPKVNPLISMDGEKIDGSCFYIFIREDNEEGYVFDDSAYFIGQNTEFLMEIEKYFDSMKSVQ